MAYDDVLSKLGGDFSKKLKQKKKNNHLVKMVEENYSNARTSKEDVKTKWIDYVKLWRGDHWKKTRASWKSDTVENICFSVVETMIPLMSDRQPQINYLPQTEDDITAAKQINQVSNYVWNSDNMNEKMPTILRDMLIIGTAIIKMRWDVEKFNGMGDITSDVIDPFSFFPDPDAVDGETMEWCILRTKMSTKQLKRIYGKDVPSDYDYSDDHERPTDTNTARTGRSTTLATVLECWYKDEQGMWRVAVVSNGVLLDDKENPYETNSHPFIFFYDHKLNGEFWGIGEFENLAPLQRELNKVKAMIVDNMIATNNTMIVVDSNAGVKVKDLRNEPGLIIEKQPAGKIERIAPPHLPAHYQNQVEMTKQSMQEVSGVFDVSKGMVSGQVSAASAIQILTENSQTRLRGKLKNVESSVKRIAEWYLIMFRQFYNEPRIVRLTGDNESFQFVQFNGQELRSEQPVIDPNTGQPMLDPETGQPQTEVLLTDFDINISSGSSMMMNKSAKYQQVLELYNAGAVDIETLLQAADIGDYKEIINRMIEYGVIKDPNQPQIDIKQVLGDLGIKVNMTTTDPTAVLTAIQTAQQKIDELEQQTGQPIVGDVNQQLKQAKELENQMLIQQELEQQQVPMPEQGVPIEQQEQPPMEGAGF